MRYELEGDDIGTVGLCLRARMYELRERAEVIGWTDSHILKERAQVLHLAAIFGITDVAIIMWRPEVPLPANVQDHAQRPAPLTPKSTK